MDAGSRGRDTSGGESPSGDRPYPLLQEGDHATRNRAGGQGGDNRDGEGTVKSIEGVIGGTGQVSYSLVPTRSFVPTLTTHLVSAFRSKLGSIDHYEWHFVPKGSVLAEYDGKPSLLAEQDYVELYAFGSPDCGGSA